MAQRQTIVSTSGSLQSTKPPAGSQPQLLARLSFENRPQLSVGRSPESDVRLDGLQISNHHARFVRTNGNVAVEDTGSTNGVYVNGEGIHRPRDRFPFDLVSIRP